MNKLTEVLIAAAAVKKLTEKQPKQKIIQHNPIVQPTHKAYTVVDIFSNNK